MQQQMTEEQAKALQEKMKNMSPEELREFQKKQCIFCQIISGQIPSKRLYEDDKCLAILDINPANPGHILLMPKEHYSIMPLVPDDEIKHMGQVAKALSQSILKTLGVEGTNIFIANGQAAGQKAQHFMIHVIPRSDGDGLESFSLAENPVDEPTLEKLKSAIRPKIYGALGLDDKEKKPEKNEALTTKKGKVVEAEYVEDKSDTKKKIEPVQQSDESSGIDREEDTAKKELEADFQGRLHHDVGHKENEDDKSSNEDNIDDSTEDHVEDRAGDDIKNDFQDDGSHESDNLDQSSEVDADDSDSSNDPADEDDKKNRDKDKDVSLDDISDILGV